MRHYLLLVVVLWAVMLPAAGGGEPFEDIENAKTPTTLTELLPEGGIDAVDIDYLMYTRSLKNGKPRGRDDITHYTVKPVDGLLVFKTDQQSIGVRDSRRTITTSYTAKGELVSYQYNYYRHGYKMMVYEGWVQDGELIINTTRFNADGDAVAEFRERRQSLEPYETAIPVQWQPLVFAYHTRQGSLGYRFDRADLSRNNIGDENRYEDVGTEQIEVDGKKKQAHLLIGKRASERGRRYNEPETLQTLVLPNGEVFSRRFTIAECEYISQRITAQEAREKYGFGVDAE